MNFNEISIKVEPEDFSYLESGVGAVDMGLGSVMGSIKTEVPDIEIPPGKKVPVLKQLMRHLTIISPFKMEYG